VSTLVLRIDGWPGHLPGQHVDVRLTGDDGYQAQRLYSIASAPESPLVSLTVEKDRGRGSLAVLSSAKVRPATASSARARSAGTSSGRRIAAGPLLLIAGGSGVVPLMAMLRHRAAVGSHVPAVLSVFVRRLAEVIYRSELRAAGRRRDGLRGGAHAHARALCGLDRPLTADRPDDAGGRRLRGPRAAAGLHLRTDGARRDGGAAAGRARPRAELIKTERFGPSS
jgi:ferredoxin-NADP reductase